MASSDVIHVSVVGTYGQIVEEGEHKEMLIHYQGGVSNGTQGEYRIVGEVPWTKFPEEGAVVRVRKDGIMHIRSFYQEYEAFHCEKILPETDIHATFRYSWPPSSNAPTVTIEVEEYNVEID